MATTFTAKTCAYYAQGKCTFGDTCRFPHVLPNTTSPLKGFLARSTGKATVQRCKHYEKGYCSKGKQCPFSHDFPLGEIRVATSARPIHTTGFGATKACHFFPLNKCREGSKCSFSHVLPDTSKQSPVGSPPLNETIRTTARQGTPGKVLELSLASPKSETTPSISEAIMERDIDGSKVLFGSGLTVHSVETVFETRTVIMTNIPLAASRELILQHLNSPHQFKHLKLDQSHSSSTARLEFQTAAQATEALTHLHGIKILGSTLSIQLDNARILTNLGSVRSTKVKVSWFKPSCIAWAHYPTYARARTEAHRLQNKEFENLKLSFELKPRTLRQTSFSIIIKGLPLTIKATTLKKLCHADTVTIGPYSFDEAESYTKVKHLLGKYGTLSSFETSSPSNRSSKLTVFAHYNEWKEAENACKGLHMRAQPFLRNSHILVENVHAIRYDIAQRRYQAIKAELFKLQKRQPVGCKLRIYDELETERICVRGYSASAKDLASLKIAVDALIRGKVLRRADGSILWEDQFEESNTQEGIRLLVDQRRCSIEFDTLQRRILIFGSPANCQSISSTILEARVNMSARTHTIQLDATNMRGLITGGLRLVEQVVGEDKARLDVRHRILTIEGSDTTLITIKKILDTLDRPCLVQSGPGCPVCLGDPVNPTVLECGHSYCTECIARYLKDQSRNRSPDCSCFFIQGKLSCKEPIGKDVLRRLLTPEEEARTFRAAYLAYVHSRPQEFLYCPTPDCSTIYRRGTGVLRCPSCLTKICSSCKVEYHDGVTCAEYEEELKKELDAMDSWKKELDVHSCPNCEANLQKQTGCNHVLCIHCNRHICWVCMITFEDSGSCYKHMGVVHGGIGGPYQGLMNGKRTQM